MTTDEIAKRLVELLRKGDFETAQNELFADDAVSIEPHATPDFEKETKGKKAIHEKGKKWETMVEATHGVTASEPLVASNSLALIMGMDVTMKQRGRTNMKELIVYTIKDGKIASEQFFM